MKWWKVILLVVGLAALFSLGIIVGHFAIPKKADQPESAGPASPSQDLDQEVLETVMAQLDANRIQENLRELSLEPHMATTARDENLVQLLLQRWQDPESGLDSVEEGVYEVLLSFPSQEQPNTVRVVSPEGTTLFTAQRSEANLTGEQADPEVVQPYAAYAPAGTPQGLLVYANRGAESDYAYLKEQGINLTGTIALTRYGGVGRGAKAVNGAKHGVAGLLVYTDPRDINDDLTLPNETFPYSWALPPSGVERGSYYEHFGDPKTPYFPATPFAFRLENDNIQGFPPIPTQPISFEDAQKLLCNLDGSVAPDSWQGALGCDYKLGPGFLDTGTFSQDSEVNVTVHNRLELRNSSNVLGIIRGAVEPDRYVLYGNHRDSWVHGAVDPSSGTAVLLEISRVLGTLVKDGKWRPRRSIVFASWGAEEFGLIGSTEFTEEFFTKLQERGVVYINVDIAVFANATLRVQGTPPAQSVIFTAAKQVPAPGKSSLTVYDNWLQHNNRSSLAHGVIPSLGTLSSGSDYAAFVHFLGITSMDIAYTYDKSKTSARIYPTYHTAFDTFQYVEKFLDPGFTSHHAVAQTVINILLRLSDSLLLPFNISDYSETLRSFLQAAQDDLGPLLEQQSIDLGPLVSAVERFEQAAAALDQRIETLKKNLSDPLKVRMVNDQLMFLERAFLSTRAFPEDYYYSHVLWAPRTSDVTTFPGLANAYEEAAENPDDPSAWAKVKKQLSIVAMAVEGAAATLEPVTDF
ncbi:aminopeptidase NAALADL1 [Trichosurus vulpecula]|uniref:aminopeptidase NAALADL1 n=1 Tax=Trichosurus vulpecula TaxID=9337 RepID=UPI00186B36F9|nr:aminopeptidase NAALADL1 [Trichosurus vulpecula]